MASELNLDEYSGIACISGDGLVHEIYNGLYSRSDWDEKASRYDKTTGWSVLSRNTVC